MSQDQAGSSPEELGSNGGNKAEQKVMISSYTILVIITLIVGVATVFLSRVLPGVTAASLSDILASPVMASSTASRCRCSCSSSVCRS